jgi:maltose O-acetyltransferase
MRHQPMTALPIVIEDNVWIGMGVKLLPGITIGQGSIIGAGSVVTENIPPYSVAMGSPCRVTKDRRGTSQTK